MTEPEHYIEAVDLAAPPTDPQQEIVAYNEGSFWFCPDCARDRERGLEDPARRRDLLDVYTYHCDQCSRSIA